jgi:hypothetical protein
MPEEFEGDLAGAVFWGADLSGARFLDVNLTNAKISHAWLVNVDIDALVDKVVINGVDVTAYVNERDPWYPLRAMLRPSDPEGMRAAWAALEDEWAKTITRAQALPEDTLHESVNDEWSFVQTLRHLVFEMDKWFTAPILGAGFHPIGLPNSGSVDFPWPGLNDNLTPSVSEARRARGSCHALSRLSGNGCGDRLHTTDRRARERHEPGARVHLHRLRGRVLAQPLCAARPRAAGSGDIGPASSNWLATSDMSTDRPLAGGSGGTAARCVATVPR